MNASIADEVPEELPQGDTQAHSVESHRPSQAADGYRIETAGVGENGGGNILGAVRRAALQERCRQLLGESFPPVYEYLKRARAEEANEKDVRRALLSLVGSKCLNDCMCVDELIFIESNC